MRNIVKKAIASFILINGISLNLFCANFTTGDNEAKLYGVHEIKLIASVIPSDRYNRFPVVQFQNKGETVYVNAFYDGNENGGEGLIWKARLYVTKTGNWSWRVTDNDGLTWEGAAKGSFSAESSNLPGKLRHHKSNPNRFATESNPDHAFIGFGDTGYTLMAKEWADSPQPKYGGAGDWDLYIDDCAKAGMTLIRAGAFGGYSVWNGHRTQSALNYPRSNWPWKDTLANGNKNEYDLVQFKATDTRLKYSLNKHSDLFFELIISPKHKNWAGMWNKTTNEKQRLNTWKYTLARFGAYPNVIFQLVYDVYWFDSLDYCGYPDNTFGIKNRSFALNWGRWLSENDPFNTMRGVGNYWGDDDPFHARVYNETKELTYIHDEAKGDIAGQKADLYYNFKKVPYFHGEDLYENDLILRDNVTPQYYYRRIFWSDILSGGNACYGGLGCPSAIIPYSKACQGVSWLRYGEYVTAESTGWHDIIHIKNFFEEHHIDIAEFEPSDDIIKNNRPKPSQIQCAKKTDNSAFIMYHPNAKDGEAYYDINNRCPSYEDKLNTRYRCSTNPNQSPDITIKSLPGRIIFEVIWMEPATGEYYSQNNVKGTGKYEEFYAPSELKGKDALLYVVKKD